MGIKTIGFVNTAKQSLPVQESDENDSATCLLPQQPETWRRPSTFVCSMMLSRSILHRRAFLGKTSRGLGGSALVSSLLPPAHAAATRGVPGTLPLLHRAKRVIWLTMVGGPSYLKTFDSKPMPESFTERPTKSRRCMTCTLRCCTSAASGMLLSTLISRASTRVLAAWSARG